MEIETRVLSLTEPDLTAVTSGHDDKPHRFSLRDRIINQRQADLIRELVILCEIAGKLKTSIGPLTRQRRYEFETELWTVRIKRMAAVDFITTGRLCRDTVELITTIPFPQRTAILTAILHPEHQELLIQECLNYEVQHHLFSFLLPNEVSFQNGN
jgi:hypothetical protein